MRHYAEVKLVTACGDPPEGEPLARIYTAGADDDEDEDGGNMTAGVDIYNPIAKVGGAEFDIALYKVGGGAG